MIANYSKGYKKLINSSLPTCPLREEKSLSQRAFSIYTDIRKLQDKAKTSSDNPGSMFYAGCATSFSREGGTGLPQNSPALAEQVETIDKKVFAGTAWCRER